MALRSSDNWFEKRKNDVPVTLCKSLPGHDKHYYPPGYCFRHTKEGMKLEHPTVIAGYEFLRFRASSTSHCHSVRTAIYCCFLHIADEGLRKKNKKIPCEGEIVKHIPSNLRQYQAYAKMIWLRLQLMQNINRKPCPQGSYSSALLARPIVLILFSQSLAAIFQKAPVECNVST